MQIFKNNVDFNSYKMFYVESIVNTINTAEKRLKEDKTLNNGEVKMGVPSHIGIFLISEIIEKFKNKYPGVKFYIENRSTKDMLDMLVKREIDLIIDNSPLGQDINGLKIVSLMKFENCFAANKKYKKLSEEIIDFKKLNKHQLLLPAERTSSRNILDEFVKKESPSLKLNPTIEVSTTEMMYDFVKRGLGIGYFTKSSIKNDLTNNKLVEIKTRTSLPETEICLAYIPEFLGNASTRFVDFLMNEIKQKEVRKKKTLRIVYTQRCLFNCSFCHKEGIRKVIDEKLSTTDIFNFFKFLKNNYNINNVHFTGGEPFLNNNLYAAVDGLKKEGANITITSNGYSIDVNNSIFELIDKLNISIHSLDEKEYEKISGVVGSYNVSVNNIKNIRNNFPLLKIEINTTLTKELVENSIELENLIKFAKSLKVDLKLIEFFPNTDKNNFVSIETILPLLRKLNYKFKKNEFRKSIFEDDDNIVSLIKCTCSDVSTHQNSGLLCKNNNDIYLSMDGDLHLCRFNNNAVSICDELKNEDFYNLKNKVEVYFDKLGNDCIYDKEERL